MSEVGLGLFLMRSVSLTLREKCPNTEFFPVRIFLYSVRIQENTDQKKLRIRTLSTQCNAYLKRDLYITIVFDY